MSTNENYISSLESYRDKMEFPMEMLAVTLEPYNENEFDLEDYKIVEAATNTIKKLKKLIALTGKYSEEELKVILSF